MAILYYGNQECTLESPHEDIIGVEIKYKGSIYLYDKTSEDYAIMAKNNKIMIFPIKSYYKGLSELFNYRGKIEIESVLLANKNGSSTSCTIHKVMDYSELMDTNAEDMTNISENLKSSNHEGSAPPKTLLIKKIIPNLRTEQHDGVLYLEDGSEYIGDYHISLESGKAMTGGIHSRTAIELYIMNKKTNQLEPSGSPRLSESTLKVRHRIVPDSGKFEINKFKKPPPKESE